MGIIDKKQNMKITKTDMYLDGGTILIQTDIGDYAIDNRIESNTPNKIFNGYPLDDNSNLMENQNEIILKLKNACKESQVDSYVKDVINKL